MNSRLIAVGYALSTFFVAFISFELKHYTGNCPLPCGRPASDPSSTYEVLENTSHAILPNMQKNTNHMQSVFWQTSEIRTTPR
jgi:hypothetical protein